MSATLLVAELGSLASETKRKNPEVKAAAEAALVALRANPESVLRSVAHGERERALGHPLVMAVWAVKG